jgi:hypothetical protein
MQPIELEMPVGRDGRIQLPERRHRIYGRNARFVILLSDTPSDIAGQIYSMNHL